MGGTGESYERRFGTPTRVPAPVEAAAGMERPDAGDGSSRPVGLGLLTLVLLVVLSGAVWLVGHWDDEAGFGPPQSAPAAPGARP